MIMMMIVVSLNFVLIELNKMNFHFLKLSLLLIMTMVMEVKNYLVLLYLKMVLGLNVENMMVVNGGNIVNFLQKNLYLIIIN